MRCRLAAHFLLFECDLIRALLGDLIHFIIGTGTDDDDQHLRLGLNELVDDAKLGSFQLDLEQPGRVRSALASKRFAVTAFADRDRILTDFFKRFCNKKLLIARQPVIVLLGFLDKLYLPVHSNSTSSMLARSASVMPWLR